MIDFSRIISLILVIFYIDFYKKSLYNTIDLDFLNCLYFLVSAKVLQEV